jgi:cytochrome P450
MEARDKSTAEPMTERALLDEVMTLIVAGHETTASALNWTWYLISQHPEAEATLHRELAAVCRGQPPTFDDLPKLTYTRQVIEETLRLYPPGWLLTRRAIADDRIGPYVVAANTDVFISPYIIHRHPQYWETAERFMPQRFTDESVAARHRYAYLPFAVGPRHCVGEFFAMVEMQLHLALMAQRFRLIYLPERPIELEPEVNLRTKHSLFMMLEKRD